MPSPHWLMATASGGAAPSPSSSFPHHQQKKKKQQQLQMGWLPHLLRRRPPLGLKNLGNTCYLNSVLQCLTYTPPLANFCLQFLHSSSCEKKKKKEEEDEVVKKKNGVDCPFCILEKRIARSLNLDAHIDAPSNISRCLRLYAAHFQWGHQEDAHEFLRYVIDACHNTCLSRSNDANASTVVKDIFGGALLSQVTCLSCASVSSKTDDIMDVSLDLFHSKSLNDALSRFFQPDLLDGDNKYSCESCKKLSPARKHMFILQAPNVLVIQLKRFEGINGGKINKDISFEEILRLSNFMAKTSQDPKPEYNLFGSIVHSGYSPESGHYYAYVKDPSGRWYCCNDSNVSLSSTEEVLSEKVYILFYLRGNQSPKFVKPILPSVGDQNILKTNVKDLVGTLKDSSMPKSSGGMLYCERNGLTGVKNGKVAVNPQIKFGLKSFSKVSSSAQENRLLKVNGKENEQSNSKQPTVLSKSSASSAATLSNSQGKPNGNGQAASLSTTIRANDPSSVFVANLKTFEERHEALIMGSSNAASNEGGASEKNCRSNKRKAEPESSAIISSGCSNSDTMKEVASHIPCNIFIDKLSLEGLQNLETRIYKKARAQLQSCGWVDEVYNFMHAQKRLCVGTTVPPTDHTILRKQLVSEARKNFINSIPQELKEDLVRCLRRSFAEANL